MILTLDFETFFSRKEGYSFSKMPTDNYIFDPRFKIHGFAYKINQGKIIWSTDIRVLEGLPWDDITLIAHHAYVEALILREKVYVRPKRIICTEALARAYFGPDQSNSLASLAPRVGGIKDKTALFNSEGKSGENLHDGAVTLTTEEIKELAVYCINDVELTWKLAEMLIPKFTWTELDCIDLTIRMFTESKLSLDIEKLKEYENNLDTERETTLTNLTTRIFTEELLGIILGNKASSLHKTLKEVTKIMKRESHPFQKPEDILQSEVAKKLVLGKILNSPVQLMELMKLLGFDPPTKVSPTTGKTILACAQNDPQWGELLESDDSLLRLIAEARLQAASNIDKSRVTRLLSCPEGVFRPKLVYHSAHTGRYGGSDGRNPQNLPKAGLIRESIIAPAGYTLVIADSAQIEPRLLCTLAWMETGMKDSPLLELINDFRDKGDPYSTFATKIFGYEVKKKTHKSERAVGKAGVLGLGYGMGNKKARKNCVNMGGPDLEDEKWGEIVKLYRETYPEIPLLWKRLEAGLRALAVGQYNPPTSGVYSFDSKGIRLPSGLHLQYPFLRIIRQDWKSTLVCKRRKNKSKTLLDEYLYGGKITENLIQALAGILIREQMVRINKRYQVALQVHDEIVCVVPQEEADEALEFVINEMSKSPAWMPLVPIAAEGVHNSFYLK